MTLQRLSAAVPNSAPAGRYCAWIAATSSGLARLKTGRQREGNSLSAVGAGASTILNRGRVPASAPVAMSARYLVGSGSGSLRCRGHAARVPPGRRRLRERGPLVAWPIPPRAAPSEGVCPPPVHRRDRSAAHPRQTSRLSPRTTHIEPEALRRLCLSYNARPPGLRRARPSKRIGALVPRAPGLRCTATPFTGPDPAPAGRTADAANHWRALIAPLRQSGGPSCACSGLRTPLPNLSARAPQPTPCTEGGLVLRTAALRVNRRRRVRRKVSAADGGAGGAGPVINPRGRTCPSWASCPRRGSGWWCSARRSSYPVRRRRARCRRR